MDAVNQIQEKVKAISKMDLYHVVVHYRFNDIVKIAKADTREGKAGAKFKRAVPELFMAMSPEEQEKIRDMAKA